ncbi:d-beta-hydroxybutyrate mitochondrial-like [Nannochloropsis oceanica]
MTSPGGTVTTSGGNGKSDLPSLLLSAQQFVLQTTNNLLHLPYLYDLSWYIIWSFYILLAPVYLLSLALFLFYETLLSRTFWTGERYVGETKEKEGEGGREGGERAIFITGCDSGFGRDLALDLTAQSLEGWKEEGKEGRREGRRRRWKVYAGCLSAEGRTTLARETTEAVKEGILTLLPLDVTNAGDIDAAVERIGRENEGQLFALVNNAGIGLAGLVDWMPLEHFQSTMDVNYFGIIRATKACLPLLKKCALSDTAPPRIVIVTSFAGLVPFMMEIVRLCNSVTTAASWDPKNVLRALRHATTAVSPRRQYLIGMDGRFLLTPLMMLPERVSDILSWIGSERYRLRPAALTRKGGGKGGKAA